MKEFKFRPLFDQIIVTADRKFVSDTGIVLSTASGQNQLKTTQTILRAGENAPEYLAPGVEVEINMATFPKKMIKQAPHDIGPDIYEVIPPLYETEDGTEFMLMNPRNLLYVLEK